MVNLLALSVDKPGDITQAMQQGYLNQEKINQVPYQRQTQQNALDLDNLKIRHAQLEDAKNKIDMVQSLLAGSVDQQSYDANRAKAAELGLDVSQEPQVYDPNYIRQHQISLLPVKDQIELELNKTKGLLEQNLIKARIGTENSQRKSFDALANQRNAMAWSISNPPQPTIGTQGEVLNPSTVGSGAPNPVAKPMGKPPVGYRWKQDGTLEPIPGGPQDPKTPQAKAPTEDQSNAALYATRMQESDKIIQDLEKSGVFQDPTLDARAGSGLTNWTVGAEGQKFVQAQRDFINAVLRRESGAVISPEEFANGRLQYFPQPGDKPATIEQKRRNRETAIEGIKNAAGPAFKPKSNIPQQAVDLLKSNPSLADQFEAKYGQGSAAMVLGR